MGIDWIRNLHLSNLCVWNNNRYKQNKSNYVLTVE